jgi:hypothetical protein
MLLVLRIVDRFQKVVEAGYAATVPREGCVVPLLGKWGKHVLVPALTVFRPRFDAPSYRQSHRSPQYE